MTPLLKWLDVNISCYVKVNNNGKVSAFGNIFLNFSSVNIPVRILLGFPKICEKIKQRIKLNKTFL